MKNLKGDNSLKGKKERRLEGKELTVTSLRVGMALITSHALVLFLHDIINVNEGSGTCILIQT